MPSFIQRVMGGWATSMKKKRTVVTGILLFMTVVLLGSTIYISLLLTSPNSSSPTEIKKTKASAVTYKKTVDLATFDSTATSIQPTLIASGNNDVNPSISPLPTLPAPTLIAKASPSIVPSIIVPTKIIPTNIPILTSAPLPTVTLVPTNTPIPTLAAAVVQPSTVPSATPTLQPLLAYKSTSNTPTLIPINDDTGGMAMVNPTATKAPTPLPTKKILPTDGVQQLPETGWVQTSSILFIVAATTILFSLLF